MFGITSDDVFSVYTKLKNRYPLLMTTAFALDEGFTDDCPVLVGKAHGYRVQNVQAVDLFPRGAHVESIVCLCRQ